MILFFDLDGTLVDSSIGIINSFKHTFSELQLEEPDMVTLRSYIGPPLETTFAHYFSDDIAIEQAITIFRNYYEKYGVRENVHPYDGIPEVLDHLKNKGHELFVTTSKNEPMAYIMLDEQNLTSYFKGIYGAIANRYEKADVIKAAMAEQNFNGADDLAIVGDTTFDIIGGKIAGIRTVGVTWGFGKEDELREAGADNICHTPEDLLNLTNR